MLEQLELKQKYRETIAAKTKKFANIWRQRLVWWVVETVLLLPEDKIVKTFPVSRVKIMMN